MNNKVPNTILNIEGIQYFNNLKYCAIIGCPLTYLGELSQLTKLRALFLWYNCLFDLRYLELSNNQISDLQPLSSLHNLCWLEVAQNQNKDLSPLRSLKQLTTLNVSNNPI